LRRLGIGILRYLGPSSRLLGCMHIACGDPRRLYEGCRAPWATHLQCAGPAIEVAEADLSITMSTIGGRLLDAAQTGGHRYQDIKTQLPLGSAALVDRIGDSAGKGT
jgi:hypothetical protein